MGGKQHRLTHIEEVINKLNREKLLDDSNIFVYASEKRIIGGAVGAAYGPVLLSVYQDTLYIHRAKLDNSYTDCLNWRIA